MADYKVPNLAGVSEKFNASQSKFDIMISSAIDGLEVDASTHKSTMLTDNTSLVTSNKAMMTELSAHPPSASPPAAEVLQAEADSEKEKLSVQLANSNVTEATTNALSSFNNFFRAASETKTLPTTDTGSYIVTTKSITITSSADGLSIIGKATIPKDATVVVDGESEKKNISDVGFTSRPIKQYQIFTEDDTSLELEEYPAAGYAPRVYGYINLTIHPYGFGRGIQFTNQEYEVGYAKRRIWAKSLGGAPIWSGTGSGVDEYSLDGKVITIEGPPMASTLFYRYTGWYNAATGCTRYFQVLYKYNSKYDPN